MGPKSRSLPAKARTTCPYCGVGCGILATRDAEGGVAIVGDPEHPANFGRLCSKGSALAETLSLDDRLLHPIVDGERASWNTALDRVASAFSRTIAEHGPDSVAMYVSGQLLTEDYYVANKLMKGFIGAANIDTNSRLCMASSVAGHRRAFGSDTVPGCYEDLEQADLVVLVGSNLAWCHPVLFQRLAAAREARGTKVVVIDPRTTATCAIADMHLPIQGGSDVALFNGLLLSLVGGNALDYDFVTRHTSGYRAALNAAMRMPISGVARATGVPLRDLLAFYDLFVRTERVVTVHSQGVNQSTRGTDKVNAIINCHLATGRIGKPGMGPFSVTGQPNAMGGREVGGLANMLAAHMSLEDGAHRSVVQGFWESPRIADTPGLKAVDLFRAAGDGRVKALWIMATNPVDSLPEADRVREALERCPFVVVSDVARHTDTTAHADVLLPSLAWGEKDGTVTNSERRISRQRAFLRAPGEARADWWQLAEVGKRMGFRAAFDYSGPAQIFAEHANLSTACNNDTRAFDIGALGAWDEAAYEDMAPVQWPQPSTGEPRARFFAEGGFYTHDRRAQFIPTEPAPARKGPTDRHPLRLNTGRIRDQWHTMTRTAKSARLMSHIGEPFVEINPADAAALGLETAMLASVESEHGAVVLRVSVTDRQRPGAVFVPIHWTDQLASAARIDVLVAGDVDPVSGQPGLKEAYVGVAPFAAAFHAVAVTRERPPRPDVAYWAMAPVDGGWRVELAGTEMPDDGGDGLLACLIGRAAGGAVGAVTTETLTYDDPAGGKSRRAALDADGLIGALLISPDPVSASRDWLVEQLSRPHDPITRLQVLAGRGNLGQRERGAIVCSCVAVGSNDIASAIEAQRCRTVDAVGAATGAGTNCGSCRAEIKRLIETRLAAMVEDA